MGSTLPLSLIRLRSSPHPLRITPRPLKPDEQSHGSRRILTTNSFARSQSPDFGPAKHTNRRERKASTGNRRRDDRTGVFTLIDSSVLNCVIRGQFPDFLAARSHKNSQKKNLLRVLRYLLLNYFPSFPRFKNCQYQEGDYSSSCKAEGKLTTRLLSHRGKCNHFLDTARLGPKSELKRGAREGRRGHMLFRVPFVGFVGKRSGDREGPAG